MRIENYEIFVAQLPLELHQLGAYRLRPIHFRYPIGMMNNLFAKK